MTRKAAKKGDPLMSPPQLAAPLMVLNSLMMGPNLEGITAEQAKLALAAVAPNTAPETHLNEMVAKGYAVQKGPGVWALLRDAQGAFCTVSGQPPASAAAPATAAPAAAPASPQTVPDSTGDDDLPWNPQIESKLDTMVALLTQLVGLLGGQHQQVPAPQQQAAPPAPMTYGQQNLPPQQQNWQPPAQQGFQQQPPMGPPPGAPMGPPPGYGQQGAPQGYPQQGYPQQQQGAPPPPYPAPQQQAPQGPPPGYGQPPGFPQPNGAPPMGPPPGYGQPPGYPQQR